MTAGALVPYTQAAVELGFSRTVAWQLAKEYQNLVPDADPGIPSSESGVAGTPYGPQLDRFIAGETDERR